MSSVAFERIDGEELFEGAALRLRRERFRHDDGEEVTREVVRHPGAVAIVAHDGESVYLVEQPREAVGEDALLELPAGKLEAGEDPEATGRRELREEIGMAADSWEPLTAVYSSPGFTDERIHVHLATGLRESRADADEGERIRVVPVPLAELDALIGRVHDAKTLVGLLLLRRRLADD